MSYSNNIFKQNLFSLVVVSADSIAQQKVKSEIFLEALADGLHDADWLDESSHYANVEWILLNSIFISAYAFFEHHLLNLSSVIEEKSDNKIKLNNISGKGVFKYRDYLFLVGGFQAADPKREEWLAVDNFNKIRNLIVHNGGIMLKDTSQKLEQHQCYSFLKKHNVSMAGLLGHIRIRQIEFIQSFIDAAILISGNIISEINSRLQPE